MTNQARDENGFPFPVFRHLVSTVTAYTASAGTSGAMPTGIRLVRVYCTSDAFIRIGGTATNLYTPVTADVAELFRVNEGDTVSAIRQTGDGNMHVTPLR